MEGWTERRRWRCCYVPPPRHSSQYDPSRQVRAQSVSRPRSTVQVAGRDFQQISHSMTVPEEVERLLGDDDDWCIAQLTKPTESLLHLSHITDHGWRADLFVIRRIDGELIIIIIIAHHPPQEAQFRGRRLWPLRARDTETEPAKEEKIDSSVTAAPKIASRLRSACKNRTQRHRKSDRTMGKARGDDDDDDYGRSLDDRRGGG